MNVPKKRAIALETRAETGQSSLKAVHAIRMVNDNLRRNANERLQLENLLMNLPSLRRN